MLYEAQFPSPSHLHDSAYRQHEFLQGMLNPNHTFTKTPRDYVWCASDGILFVRRRIPSNQLLWQPVDVPPEQSVITLQLEARARSARGDQREEHRRARLENNQPPQVSRGNRLAVIEPNEAMTWLTTRAPMIGLQIEDVEVEARTKLIEKPNQRRNKLRSKFVMLGTSFVAVATVIDTQLFEAALANGVGDCKAFGFGFIHFWRRG